jgi:hypothetical protein
MLSAQARRESNPATPGLEPTPSNAGVDTNLGTKQEHPLSEDWLAALAQRARPADPSRARPGAVIGSSRCGNGPIGDGGGGMETHGESAPSDSIASPVGGDYAVKSELTRTTRVP